MFNGFPSVSVYEAEARRTGFVTKRIPASKDGQPYFILITRLATQSPTSIATWHLFAEDGSRELLSGVINGHDANYIGKLTAHGFEICAE